MPAEKFQLSTYTPHILQIAEEHKVDVDTALQYFIINLTTMKEHHKGAQNLNYHELGQQWNKLLSKEKVAQKADTKARLSKYHRAGGNS